MRLMDSILDSTVWEGPPWGYLWTPASSVIQNSWTQCLVSVLKFGNFRLCFSWSCSADHKNKTHSWNMIKISLKTGKKWNEKERKKKKKLKLQVFLEKDWWLLLGQTFAVMKSSNVAASGPLSYCHSFLDSGFLHFYLCWRAVSLLSKPHLRKTKQNNKTERGRCARCGKMLNDAGFNLLPSHSVCDCNLLIWNWEHAVHGNTFVIC